MSDPFVAEIRATPYNFAPRGWAMCNGQILAISQNTALFSLLGTFYGGDGKSTFGLPDLRGRVTMHPGQGPGLSQHGLGETGGSDTVTLLASEMPAHNHALLPAAGEATERQPTPLARLATSEPGDRYAAAGTQVALNDLALTPAGGSLPHNNLMPYLTMNYIIALQGIFPPRS